MKLIPMTDYILEIGVSENTDYQFANKAMAYANFLKQPLELWMFVPCDEDGNILEEPYFNGMDRQYYGCKMDKYQKAKERVLFEGFEVSDEDSLMIDISINDFKLSFDKELKSVIGFYEIEHLVMIGEIIDLTPTAIKQIKECK